MHQIGRILIDVDTLTTCSSHGSECGKPFHMENGVGHLLGAYCR